MLEALVWFVVGALIMAGVSRMRWYRAMIDRLVVWGINRGWW